MDFDKPLEEKDKFSLFVSIFEPLSLSSDTDDIDRSPEEGGEQEEDNLTYFPLEVRRSSADFIKFEISEPSPPGVMSTATTEAPIEDFELEVDNVDLYDDMITSHREEETQEGGESPSHSPNQNNTNNNSGSNGSTTYFENGVRESPTPLRKYQVYVGNLTWWTSDKDIEEAARDIGINDFVEVKFYENRTNGQSKGYCVLSVGSETSLKLLHDKLSKKELNGQFPVVTPPTKQALNQFESQSKTRPSPSSNDKNEGNNNMMNSPPMGLSPRNMMNQQGSGGRNIRGPPPGMGGGPQHRGMPGMNMGPGFMGHGPRPMMPHNMSGGGPPMQGPPGRMPMMEPFFPGPGGPPPNMGNSRGPPPPVHPQNQQRQDWQRPPMNQFPPHGPPHGHNMPPQGMPVQGQMRPMGPGPMQGPPQNAAPAPHMNPAFFHSGSGGGAGPGGPLLSGPPGAPPPVYQQQQAPPPTQFTPTPEQHRPPPAPPTLSEAEFEEIMSRNRTVSSSAITRAVQDAANGEFTSAIDTLSTAISLIRQSKVALDDRCKILVSSLQDTLNGIEAKSYRERSRSRDRDRHHRSRRRERSRSREYRERSRDRYYEYGRDRERSRSREYRERPREESGSRAYYDERYRERERLAEREREVARTRSEPERPREREAERERETVTHRPSTRH